MLESAYQAKLIRKIKRLLPGCVVLKNDPEYLQGIPDLTVFHGPRYGLVEVKVKKPTSASDFQPNQEWYIAKFQEMAFGACIYPENEREVLDALQQALRLGR